MKQAYIVLKILLCFFSFLRLGRLILMCDGVSLQMKRKLTRVKEIDPDSQLQDAAKSAMEKFNKFKEIFLLQQSMMQKETSGGQEPYTKNKDGRFVQIKGNVNPELIHETLYDSQQLRDPTPLILDIQETDQSNSEDENLSLYAQISREAQTSILSQIDEFEKNPYHLDKEFLSSIQYRPIISKKKGGFLKRNMPHYASEDQSANDFVSQKTKENHLGESTLNAKI